MSLRAWRTLCVVLAVALVVLGLALVLVCRPASGGHLAALLLVGGGGWWLIGLTHPDREREP